MTEDKMQKIFPSYFKNFEMPSEAIEQEIDVYRACPTGKLEPESFLNSYEANGYKTNPDLPVDDPRQYSLSTYIRLKDVRRFVSIDSKYQPPFPLAKGHTTLTDGLSCITKKWKKECKNSHVDWWLYVGAEPWLVFKEVKYEDEKRRLEALSTQK